MLPTAVDPPLVFVNPTVNVPAAEILDQAIIMPFGIPTRGLIITVAFAFAFVIAAVYVLVLLLAKVIASPNVTVVLIILTEMAEGATFFTMPPVIVNKLSVLAPS